MPPERCAAIEDSGNGIRAAHAAGMRVIAIPNRRYPPSDDALALADVVLASIDELEAGRPVNDEGALAGPLRQRDVGYVPPAATSCTTTPEMTSLPAEMSSSAVTSLPRAEHEVVRGRCPGSVRAHDVVPSRSCA